MPYIHLQASDDYASIYYITNSSFINVGGFDAAKPTIIILHPQFLDSTWLQNQFGDPRLNDVHNLIAFDMRSCGRSVCRPSGKHDSWVDAADLAFCIQRLHLPPAHVLALEGISINCAQRLAVLFPEMVLSLTFCNVPSPTELKWVFTAYDELMQSWCLAEDLESFEHVGMESVSFVVGPECDVDLQDDLIAYWEIAMPPTKRLRVVETLNVLMHRTPLNPETYATITQPVLLIHGERNETCPRKYAEKLQSQLTGVEGGAILYTVKGASGTLSIVPGSASIANQVFVKFLSRLPHNRSDVVPPKIPIEERMQSALEKLAAIVEDPKISERNPLSSMSFSCLAPEVMRSQTDSLAFYRKGLDNAFLPVGPDGRPIRKFSERKDYHWFHGEKDGISYAGNNILLGIGKQDPIPHEKHIPMPQSDPISPETASEGRVRRGVFTPSSVDKLVIKGSMAKVVGSAPVTPFQRLLM